jgi:hypothetical protein
MSVETKDDVQDAIKKLLWDYLFDHFKEEITPAQFVSLYKQCGLSFEDESPESREVLDERCLYIGFVSRQMYGDLFSSHTAARVFFEDKWMPIMLGGKAALLRKGMEKTDAPLEFFAKQAWAEMYNTKYVEDFPKPKKAAKWWMDSVDYIPVFFNPDPNYQPKPQEYNLFNGFRYEAIESGKAEKYLTLIKEGICNNSQEYFDYLIDWMSQIIQSPHKKEECGISVAIKGEAGVGKSSFARVLANLLGRQAHVCNTVDSIVGNFNGILYEKLLIVGEESLWGGYKREYSCLKQLITDDKMQLGFKFREVFQADNYLRFIFLTNADWCAPNDIGDRRFFVLEASDKYKKDTAFFKSMWEDMNNGGYEDLMFILKNRDISLRDFQNTLPLTEAAVENIEQSLSPVATVVQEWVEYGFSSSAGIMAGWGSDNLKRTIYDLYCERAKELGLRIVRDSQFGREFKKMIPSVKMRQESDENRTRIYVLPDRDKANGEFENYKRKR